MFGAFSAPPIHMTIIEYVHAREIMDSRGNPTLEVDVGLDGEALVLDPPLSFAVRPAALRIRLPTNAIGVSPAGRKLEARQAFHVLALLLQALKARPAHGGHLQEPLLELGRGDGVVGERRDLFALGLGVTETDFHGARRGPLAR